jgi:NAD(P)-dependent dehydrogenase (short-subunit alcohol dehydrogenase family)
MWSTAWTRKWAAILENSEGSEFDPVDELEDDFVVFANNNPEGSTSGEFQAAGEVKEIAVKALFDKAEESFGKIHIVVNSAGIILTNIPILVETTERSGTGLL